MQNAISCVHLAVRGCVFLLLLALSSSAFATLGQNISSVQSDGVHMNAEVHVLPGQSYSVHEMRSSSGTTVREFVSSAGEVFGVAWQGPSAPDLRQLLGQYFDEYVRTRQTSAGIARRAVHVETGDLVVESGGHMRFIVGRAYLRSKLPDGVAANAIR
jgi:hypothetical protein